MLAIKNTIPYKSDLLTDYLEATFSIENTHTNMVSSFDNINTMYSESSVMEDVILNKYLYLYGSAKLISGNGTSSSFVTESFLSQNYFDSQFPIDKPLNIDIQNGDLTLPIVSTRTIPVNSVIIESESNGSPGDSQNNNSNSDLSVITKGDSASLFVYDKMVNSLSMSDLYLTLTLKMSESAYINGVYVRLYSDTGSSYPNIETVESSNDGETWVEVANEFKLQELKNINKADYYIRFQSTLGKMIRIRFSQPGYSPISTGFGTRYKYSIGVREVSVKQTIYDSVGEYISIPFSSRKAVSYVRLDKEDTGDVKYFISANNGTKWTEIIPGEKTYLYNQTLGLRDGTDINTIRLRALMDKGTVAISKDKVKEFALISDSEKYFLRDVPIDLTVFTGNHISYGELKEYAIQMKDITRIDSSILEDDINIDCTATLYYVPFYDGMENDLTLKLNGARVKNDRTIYEFRRHQDKNHSIIVLKNKAITENSGLLTIAFKKLATTKGDQTVDLPSIPFSSTSNSFIIEEVANGSTRTLHDTEFVREGKTVTIVDASFNPDATYYISYIPSVDVTELASREDGTNEVIVHNIKPIEDMKLFFEYTIESDSNIEASKYFTPICNQYVLELR